MLLIHLFIGALAFAALFGLVELARRRQLMVPIWGWVVTVLGLLYGVFVLEVLVTLLDEGAPQAAAVTVVSLGLLAVIWGVLLGRFVFVRPAAAEPKEVSHV